MIYLKRPNDAELREFETAEAALTFIKESGWNPIVLEIWRSETPLVKIGFEELNALAGRPVVDREEIGEEVHRLVAALDVHLRSQRGWRITLRDLAVSTGGFHDPKRSIREHYGDPMAIVNVETMMDDHLMGLPPKFTAEKLRKYIEAADGPAGWLVLRCEPASRAHDGRRDHRLVLSKPRDEFPTSLAAITTE